MPTIANITIKKNDGTTDVIYTAVSPSGGERSPAVWRNNTVGTAAAHRPTFQLSARKNGPGTARRMEGQYVYPTTITGTDGKISVADKAIFDITAVLPQGMPQTDLDEAVSQCFNLLAATLNKDCFKAGYSAT